MTHPQDVLANLDGDAVKPLLLTALQQLGVGAAPALSAAAVNATLSLLPREDGLAAKDIPVETLLHKVTMMRDKLRLVEQRINAANTLVAQERFALQGQVTAVHHVLLALGALLELPATPVPVTARPEGDAP